MKKILSVVLIVTALLSGVAANILLKSDFVTVDGQSKRWREFKGQWVVVNYFAQWCAPCLREIPELNRFYLDNKEIAVFAVSFDPLEIAELRSLAERYHIRFPIVAEIDSAPWQQKPTTLPHTLIIDPTGQVVKELKGEQTADGLRQLIKQLQGT